MLFKLKALFKKKPNVSDIKIDDLFKPVTDEMLRNGEPQDIVVKLGSYLANKCDFGDNLAALTKAEQVIYLCQTFATEIYSGGLSYFYLEPCGNNCNETFAALKELGASEVYSLMEKSNKFLKNNFPKDKDERNEILLTIIDDDIDEKLTEICSDMIDVFDRKETTCTGFYYTTLIYNYYLKHKDEVK